MFLVYPDCINLLACIDVIERSESMIDSDLYLEQIWITSLGIAFTDLCLPVVQELQEVLLVLLLPEVPSLPSAPEHLTWTNRKTDKKIRMDDIYKHSSNSKSKSISISVTPYSNLNVGAMHSCVDQQNLKSEHNIFHLNIYSIFIAEMDDLGVPVFWNVHHL